ncbi:DNA-binding protein [Candidatus Woesearchaeota archaeon]|nr:DNA-binding protein [Candidatus Woesearchaeota archaeon]
MIASKGVYLQCKLVNSKQDKEAEITQKGEVRTFDKFGKQGRVCNATIKDASGEMKLTLWNEEIDTYNVGDKIKISNGYVNEFQGEKQLSAGRFGKIEVLK